MTSHPVARAAALCGGLIRRDMVRLRLPDSLEAGKDSFDSGMHLRTCRGADITTEFS